MSIADKLTKIAENEQKVYDAGVERVWYGITNGGTREYYYRGFQGWGLSAEGTKPVTDITVVGDGRYMFYNVKNVGTKPIDFKAIEEQQRIRLDFSRCTNAQYLCQNAEIDAFNVMDLSNANANSDALYFLFAESKIRWVEKLIVSENTSKFNTSFYMAKSLTHCIFDGVINKTGLAIPSYTLLDKESITSIINILSDDTSGLSVSINGIPINKAFETAEGKNDGMKSEEWLSLVATKPNWTIAT